MNEHTAREILHRRALELARPVGQKKDEDAALELFLFSLQSETYGMESQYASEVFAMQHYTPVPGTPPFVMGVTSLHGEIIPLIDLGHFFEQPRMALTNLNKVVVVRSARLIFGIVVDEPLGIERVPVRRLREPPVTPGDGRTTFLRAIDENDMIVLDMPSILNSDRLIVGGQRVAGSATGAG